MVIYVRYVIYVVHITATERFRENVLHNFQSWINLTSSNGSTYSLITVPPTLMRWLYLIKSLLNFYNCSTYYHTMVYLKFKTVQINFAK